MTSNTTRKIRYKVWISSVEYRSWEYKFDIKESDGNMVEPIF